MVNNNIALDLRLGRRQVHINRHSTVLAPLLSAVILLLTTLMMPFILVFGLAIALIGLLKPVIMIAGFIVSIVGVFTLIGTGHGWVTLFIGLAMLFVAKRTKVTFNR